MQISKSKNQISIVVASDNFYAVLIAALLKSIEETHHTDEQIDFHIIDDGILPESKSKLLNIVSDGQITVHWHEAENVLPKEFYSIPIDSSAFPRTTYFRIFAERVIQRDVDRMLYLDADIILLDDISKLWHMDLQNYPVGAIQDVGRTVDCEWAGLPNYAELGLDPKTKYFNAGVLLIDLIKWREESFSGQIISALIKNKKHVKLADQYGFNVVFANKWKDLDPKWNWFAHLPDEEPSLIHFLDIKPIFKSYRSNLKYKDYFFSYLSLTPWSGYKQVSDSSRLMRKAYNKIKKRFKIFLKSLKYG